MVDSLIIESDCLKAVQLLDDVDHSGSQFCDLLDEIIVLKL